MVPVFHRAMVRMLDRPHPVGVLNLGGVANVTYRRWRATSIACDTGPGNALIDDFIRLRTGASHDATARAAAAGQGRRERGRTRAGASVFRAPPPKSLDRNAFRHWVAEQGRLADKSTEDGAATLTAITAAAIARAVDAAAAGAATLDRRRRRHAQSRP